MINQVPLLDLGRQYAPLKAELDGAVLAVLGHGHFINGPEVGQFEKAAAAYVGAKHAIGVASGTDALLVALRALGVGPGAEVVIPTFTFFATAGVVSNLGARPVFTDVEADTYNMDPRSLEKAITSKTKAIMPVHLFGQMADMDPILEIARRHKLRVIEDACQAHGAEYYSKRDGRWRKAGSMGTAAAFSFYPGKNLGACGEAGALTTNDKAIAEKVQMLRDHGQSKKYIHEMEGYNGRLDTIQAGFLQIKLKRLRVWNEQRRKHANRYAALLQDLDGIKTPVEPEWCRGVYHLYVIRTKERFELQKFLLEQNIVTGLHYPIPLHLQKAYAGYGFCDGDYPATEAASREILSLPMFPGLTEQQQDFVVDGIRRFVSSRAAYSAIS